jgi:glycerol kinase
MEDLILAIDQGTSSTKALLMNVRGEVVAEGLADLETTYFPNGHVEQDPLALMQSVESAVKACLSGIDPKNIKGIGISNQRETFVLWDAEGKPLSPAVVWACKRSTAICEKLQDQNDWIKSRTGLLIDPYFSGTKVLWLLENDPSLHESLEAGELYFGTVDTWILFQLTQGRSYACDLTNASRTLFFNLESLTWDTEILANWGLSSLHLPALKRSSDDFGQTDLFGLAPDGIPVVAMIGDSHASMFGETCFTEGDTKMTLGTGCSLLVHVGNTPRVSTQGLLSTIAWSTQGEVAYAWEGAIVACGSMMEWLKKDMGILDDVRASASIAESVEGEPGVFIVPAFSGLGAPFWQMDRKASFVGMRFGTKPAHLIKATLESIAFQIKAVVDAMEADFGTGIQQIAMHGGLSKNLYVQKCLQCLLSAPIQQQDNPHISAQGAAFLAGLQLGIYPNLKALKQLIRAQSLAPITSKHAIQQAYATWKELIETNTY